ncbi:MAG: lamin tail domain-containing protein, partial [Bacteroidota bacterium]
MRAILTTLVCLCCLPSLLEAQVALSELMNWNTKIEAGQGYAGYCDWVELYAETTTDLSQWSLSDDPERPQRWAFPEEVILKAGEYLTVFADGYDIGFHTNFRLASSGEWIGLYNPEGQIVDSLSIPFLQRNLSMGRHLETKAWGWYDQPTPGAANESVWYRGFAERPYFSQLPTFYQETQTIQILHDDPEVTIRYELGGFLVDSQSIIHNSPISLSSTNVIRAKAYKAGYLPSKTVTQTYFIAETPPGIPVMAITTNPPNLWDDQIGIYVTGTNGIRDNGPASDPPRNWNQDWERESVF